MIPVQLSDANIYRGDDETFSNTLQISPTEPYDLRVWAEIRCQIREEESYDSPLVTTLTTSDNSIEIAGDEHNRLIFKIDSFRTILFNKKKTYYSDIKFINSDGQAKTLFKKNFVNHVNITEKGA